MNIVFLLLVIFGASFCLKETSGPFDLIDKLRNKLFTTKYIGVFFYKLFSCYFCLGSDIGWVFYLILTGDFNPLHLFMWAMAGGIFSYSMNHILSFFNSKN